MHAVQRMFQRRISEEVVLGLLDSGETIEVYSGDTPYPSRLILGWDGRRAIHLVIADNVEKNETIVITVYEPEPDQWEDGFRRRKQ